VAVPAVLVLLVLIGWVAWEAYLARPTLEPGDGKGGSSSEAPGTHVVATLEAERAGKQTESRRERSRADAQGDVRELPRREIQRRIQETFVVCELLDGDGRSWKMRGVLIDSSGVVLCRAKPLLGAYSGICRLSTRNRARVEILGVAYHAVESDLALLRIRPSPAGYPSLPLLEANPWDVFAAGDEVLVFSDFAPIPTTVSEPFYRSDGGLGTCRLATSPRLPVDSFVTVDLFGFIVGLCRVEPSSPSGAGARTNADSRFLVVGTSELARRVDQPVSWTLQELTRSSFEGTFVDLAGRGAAAFQGQAWADAVDLLNQALERVRYDLPDESEVAPVEKQLLQSYLAQLDSLHSGGRSRQAGALAEVALMRFSDSPKLWVCLAEARLAENEISGGIAALVEAQTLRPQDRDVQVLLEGAYLRLAEDAAQRGDTRSQEAILLESLERLPNSGVLQLELAEYFFQIRALDEASRLASQVPRLTPTLRAAAAELIARIERELNSRDAVVIPISSDSTSYRTRAVANDALALDFIIDTGSTSTTVPVSAALRLGYDLESAPQRRVQTANGVLTSAVIQLRSLKLEGYVVPNLEVIVLPDATPPLLGLNFLRHFRYTVDATRREFRLERP